MKDEEQTVTSLSERDQEIEALYNSICKPRPLLVVLSGPSGVGKDATLQMLKQTNYPFHFVVTATTRPNALAKWMVWIIILSRSASLPK